jgi:hypothetical protein
VSAIRLPGPDGRVRLLDPFTRAEFTPDPLPVRGSGPVEVVRPATCAPAARPASRLLTDEENRARHVRGALAAQEARRRNQAGTP